MSLDVLAVADALAARYAGMTPPDGLKPVVISTARLEKNLVDFPAVAVFPPGPGDMSILYGNNRRKAEIPFLVRLYFEASSGDISRVATALYRWQSVMIDATHAATKLGLAPIVDAALPESAGLGEFRYAAATYAGVQLGVRVWTSDTIDLVPN